ncbi:unnamed protein product [Amoebophrya sp. A120]|nr:unnamed protein product [Amoebophrya sp. A120]|eukprot:GSA120T00014147001.1
MKIPMKFWNNSPLFVCVALSSARMKGTCRNSHDITSSNSLVLREAKEKIGNKPPKSSALGLFPDFFEVKSKGKNDPQTGTLSVVLCFFGSLVSLFRLSFSQKSLSSLRCHNCIAVADSSVF